MKIAYAIPVHRIEPGRRGTVDLSGVESWRIRPPGSLPMWVEMPLAICLVAPSHEAGVEHTMFMRILDSRLDVIMDETPYRVTVLASSDAIPGWDVRNVISMKVVFMANKPGPYSIETRINDEPQASVNFYVEA